MSHDAMTIQFYKDPDAFLQEVQTILSQNEVEHNLILSLCHRLADPQTKDNAAGAWFATVMSKNHLALAAMQTPGHNLVLSRQYHAGAEEILAEALQQKGISFPGIVGPSDVTAGFVNVWGKRTGQVPAECMDQIIYSLKKVLLPPAIPGQMRLARMDEAPLIAQWIRAFIDDALPKFERKTPEEALTQAQTVIAAGRMAVWDVDGKPVAMAGVSGTSRLARITLVYTPPETRGYGYASAVVAQFSHHQLEQGRNMCCLYADARNPVSNSIYRKIGYEFVGRSSQYTLTPPGVLPA